MSKDGSDGHPQRHAPTDMDVWKRSDRYHNERLIGTPDASLIHSVENSVKSGLPNIALSEAQAKFLHLLARTFKAKRILEVGTLGGYSTIWLARALPEDGELITLEISETHAEVARQNLAHAGLDSKVKVIVGPAIESLPKIEPSFDLAFIDADKENNLEYFKEAKRLVRQGGIIIVDNVVCYGRVSDPEYKDEWTEGVRRMLDYIKGDKEVDATTIATVGDKGYDGFMYALRL
ncbi:hypothetical protein M422DRAFT_25796 [Sphaerobolus stellatus SS14]|uniref:Caffeoyl-CoA O-methyltransferase n=1 Tax=Sphaerobolus stellatus (strain SS14) TaxID=990650 RepID=A0A0C9VWK1_SPHS4|nr:hypothetical protein M422DRAFT_30927 [Sphaerobolus stellatus SS14]KIJ52713.1 hypothetical protein M422DRAFT_25796 [Sphaerobolus stellatus SS14]